MFGRGGSGQDDWRVDKEWLEGLQAVDLPPVDTLMQTCLLQPIQEQVHPPPPLPPYLHTHTTPLSAPLLLTLCHSLLSLCLFPSRRQAEVEHEPLLNHI